MNEENKSNSFSNGGPFKQAVFLFSLLVVSARVKKWKISGRLWPSPKTRLSMGLVRDAPNCYWLLWATLNCFALVLQGRRGRQLVVWTGFGGVINWRVLRVLWVEGNMHPTLNTWLCKLYHLSTKSWELSNALLQNNVCRQIQSWGQWLSLCIVFCSFYVAFG